MRKAVISLFLCLLILLSAAVVFPVSAAQMSDCVHVLVSYDSGFKRFSVPVDKEFTVQYFMNVTDATKGKKYTDEEGNKFDSEGCISNIDAEISYDSNYLTCLSKGKNANAAFPNLQGATKNFGIDDKIYFNASAVEEPFYTFNNDDTVLAAIKFKAIKAGNGGLEPDVIIDLKIKTMCALTTKLDRIINNYSANPDVTVIPSFVREDDVTFAVGDVDHNNKINTVDAVRMSRELVGGYSQSIDYYLANVDYAFEDGAKNVFNTKDIVFVRRFLVGGYGVSFV